MADTDQLRSYTPRDFPKLGNEPNYLMDEFRKLSATVTTINAVMKKLEARIAALGG